MNEEHEIIVMRSFRDNYPDFPKGRLIKSESPDFVLNKGPKSKIGIELVQLLPPPEHHYSMAGIMKPKYAYEQLLMTVMLKEKKRKNYNDSRLGQVWLIIHFDYLDDAESFNLHNQVGKWYFPNGFDRVFLFNLFVNKVYEFKHQDY